METVEEFPDNVSINGLTLNEQQKQQQTNISPPPGKVERRPNGTFTLSKTHTTNRLSFPQARTPYSESKEQKIVTLSASLCSNDESSGGSSEKLTTEGRLLCSI